MTELRTRRLLLRPWTAADRAPFAALNADPEVMRHFPSVQSTEASDAFADRAAAHVSEHGWGLWAVEVPGVTMFIGYVGLALATFPAPFTPALEVGWRLDRAHWGQGYAPEGAVAALTYAFDVLRRDEVVSFTAVGNANSRRVMGKIGLRHDPAGDFDHPNVPEDSPVRRHVLYRIDAPTFAQLRPNTSYRSSSDGAK